MLLRALVARVVLLAGLIAGWTLAIPAAAAPTGAERADEATFVSLVNGLRASAGLNRLPVDDSLTAQARSWAATMASDDRLAHAGDLSVGITADWTVLGENVGVHTERDLDALFSAFVASPSHHANLIDDRYDAIGVGVVHGPDGKVWTTHRFMATRSPAPSPPATGPPTTGADPPTTATPPTTEAPTTTTTHPPTTTTQPPTTQPPTTQPPTTQPPTTQPPTTQPPTTQPPTTQPPTTQPPATQPPTTRPPTTRLPTTTRRRATGPPTTRPPTTRLPTTTRRRATGPPTTRPATRAPATQPPTTRPTIQPPTNRPTTRPPTTRPTATQPPTNRRRATGPPTTRPPTRAPATQPPVTQPPTATPTRAAAPTWPTRSIGPSTTAWPAHGSATTASLPRSTKLWLRPMGPLRPTLGDEPWVAIGSWPTPTPWMIWFPPSVSVQPSPDAGRWPPESLSLQTIDLPWFALSAPERRSVAPRLPGRR